MRKPRRKRRPRPTILCKPSTISSYYRLHIVFDGCLTTGVKVGIFDGRVLLGQSRRLTPIILLSQGTLTRHGGWVLYQPQSEGLRMSQPGNEMNSR